MGFLFWYMVVPITIWAARKCHVSSTEGSRPSGSLVLLYCFSRLVLQVDDKLGTGSHSDFFEIAKLFLVLGKNSSGHFYFLLLLPEVYLTYSISGAGVTLGRFAKIVF